MPKPITPGPPAVLQMPPIAMPPPAPISRGYPKLPSAAAINEARIAPRAFTWVVQVSAFPADFGEWGIAVEMVLVHPKTPSSPPIGLFGYTRYRTDAIDFSQWLRQPREITMWPKEFVDIQRTLRSGRIVLKGDPARQLYAASLKGAIRLTSDQYNATYAASFSFESHQAPWAEYVRRHYPEWTGVPTPAGSYRESKQWKSLPWTSQAFRLMFEKIQVRLGHKTFAGRYTFTV